MAGFWCLCDLFISIMSSTKHYNYYKLLYNAYDSADDSFCALMTIPCGLCGGIASQELSGVVFGIVHFTSHAQGNMQNLYP